MTQEAYMLGLAKLSTRQLKKQYREMDGYIKDGCFGTSDLIQLELMARELARRKA